MNHCIAIDRQYGSGGREVAKLLSSTLNIPFYDGDLLMIAAEKYGLHPGIMRERDEKRSGSFLYDIAMFTGSLNPYEKMNEPYAMYQAIRDTIKRLAAESPCIFIGRGADIILKEICTSISVFIYASSMEDRVRRAVRADGITAKNVESYIKKKDYQRKEYYRFFAEGNWGIMDNYDLCLNTSSFGYKGCADVIADIYRK